MTARTALLLGVLALAPCTRRPNEAGGGTSPGIFPADNTGTGRQTTQPNAPHR